MPDCKFKEVCEALMRPLMSVGGVVVGWDCDFHHSEWDACDVRRVANDYLHSEKFRREYAKREELVKQVRRYLTKATGLKTIVNLIQTHGLKPKEDK